MGIEKGATFAPAIKASSLTNWKDNVKLLTGKKRKNFFQKSLPESKNELPLQPAISATF